MELRFYNFPIIILKIGRKIQWYLTCLWDIKIKCWLLVKIEFPLPIVACNLMIEYADFYENIQVQIFVCLFDTNWYEFFTSCFEIAVDVEKKIVGHVFIQTKCVKEQKWEGTNFLFWITKFTLFSFFTSNYYFEMNIFLNFVFYLERIYRVNKLKRNYNIFTMIDFEENIFFYHQGAGETLQCPRCSASVPVNPGVCNNCGENVFQVYFFFRY